MNSFVFDIGNRSRRVSRVLGKLRSDLQNALVAEKKARKLTQQKIAETLNVNRSVINRQLIGKENLTVKSAVELAWAMGWEAKIEVFKPQHSASSNEIAAEPMIYAENMPVPIATSGQLFLLIENAPKLPVSLPNTKEFAVRAE
jgi:transcriptional regulator with XRE-family HTH domain